MTIVIYTDKHRNGSENVTNVILVRVKYINIILHSENESDRIIAFCLVSDGFKKEYSIRINLQIFKRIYVVFGTLNLLSDHNSKNGYSADKVLL